MPVRYLFPTLHTGMSHNLSRRTARNAVLATIGRYGNCVLVLTCPKCRERREPRIAPL